MQHGHLSRNFSISRGGTTDAGKDSQWIWEGYLEVAKDTAGCMQCPGGKPGGRNPVGVLPSANFTIMMYSER